MTYLDNAATTGQKPEAVLQAVSDAMRHLSVNAGRGSYTTAQQAVQQMDACRNNLLTLAHIPAGYHVYFTPSATIALNQIILGLPVDCYTNFYVTPFEHNAVMRPLHAITERAGAQVRVLPFSRETWMLDTTEAESMLLANRPDYVFVSMVSNTTGYQLPVAEIVRMAHAYGAKVIVDAAQAFGTIDADFAFLDADAYVFAGHKTLYGPYGSAGFLLRDSFQLSPGLFGGTGTDSLNLSMPSPEAGRFEPGSANIPALCGLNAAVQWLLSVGVKKIEAHEQLLIRQLLDGLSRIKRVRFFVPPDGRESGILAFCVEGYQSHEVGEILNDEFDIAVRTGYQCAPLIHDWLGTKLFAGVVRASVSWFSTEEDIAKLLDALRTL